MKSYRKKRGFTITEIVIAMTFSVIALGIIWTMFNTSNKIISDVTIKSDLQKEGQVIQEKLSNIGMQASGIADVYHNDEDIHIIQINLYYMSSDKTLPVYVIYDKTNKKLYVHDISNNINIEDINHELLLNEDYKLLSDKVDSIEINNEDINDIKVNDLINVSSVEFAITLSKKKNYNKEIVSQLINVRTVFRNKNTQNT